ncbi:hypothetical protein MKS88_003959 [Plasmodium brasilianum]|uniref:Uncharacterized protein n=1 Tax=Plasmodium brasilianum TaxID=5824 RepID=A0ACB9Y8T2_PLABR|nr:hypothetical protein MKS88_003959 [Plasmodium brasilianum]
MSYQKYFECQYEFVPETGKSEIYGGSHIDKCRKVTRENKKSEQESKKSSISTTKENKSFLQNYLNKIQNFNKERKLLHKKVTPKEGINYHIHNPYMRSLNFVFQNP